MQTFGGAVLSDFNVVSVTSEIFPDGEGSGTLSLTLSDPHGRILFFNGTIHGETQLDYLLEGDPLQMGDACGPLWGCLAWFRELNREFGFGLSCDGLGYFQNGDLDSCRVLSIVDEINAVLSSRIGAGSGTSGVADA